uniref:Transposase (Putative), gypsy type n=1 Tax=Tanacetum cinerariifolium TaxID=118510 RepID=A0A6L2JYP7_TANCI|nr:hypothetical protein [Tanacetum cinerariifolium]
MWTENCLSERKRLESECKKQADLLKARDGEIKDLKAQLLLKEAKAASAEKDAIDGKVAEFQSFVVDKERELKDLNVMVSSFKSQNDDLVDQIYTPNIGFFYCGCDTLISVVAKLDADLVEMALHLEEKFYPHLLTTISGRRWLLTRGLKLAVVKCLNSPEYLAALGSAIDRAIEKGMQSGLSAVPLPPLPSILSSAKLSVASSSSLTPKIFTEPKPVPLLDFSFSVNNAPPFCSKNFSFSLARFLFLAMMHSIDNPMSIVSNESPIPIFDDGDNIVS